LIQAVDIPAELQALTDRNKEGVARLRTDAPALRTAKKVHYADILERLIKDRLAPVPGPTNGNGHEAPGLADVVSPSLSPSRPSRIGAGPRIDKSTLALATERRLRDKSHLKFVAMQPCLICGREPSQAHHLTFCQKRGLSLKVSDEFTVPLCGLHHDELHRSGAEREWWEKHHINPEPIAAELWARTRMPTARGMESARSLEPLLATNGSNESNSRTGPRPFPKSPK
jgi:hypothetical protein